MNLFFQNSEIVKTFRPLDVSSYLRLHKWKHQETIQEKYSVWTKEGDFEISLPLVTSFSDIGKRIRDVIETLQSEESRAFEEILEDITTPHADIIRARLAPDGDLSGTLTLEDGSSVFRQMRDLMLSAACAAVLPKQVFEKRKPDQAMRYLRDARIGQTRRGSYIITVLSPVPPVLAVNGQNSLLPELEEEPFSRRTVHTLANALTATIGGIQSAAESGNITVITEGVSKGISANLCEAIMGLNEGSGNRGVEFSFSWSAARGAPKDVQNTQRINPDSMPFLEETSRYFRQTSEREDVEVFGIVHKLEEIGQAHAGKVTITGTVDGERKTVFTELKDDLHKLALKAYEERLNITCTGELVKEGKSYRLINPRNFQIIREMEAGQ